MKLVIDFNTVFDQFM